MFSLWGECKMKSGLNQVNQIQNDYLEMEGR